MSIVITTVYTTNPNTGAGKVVAKGAGRQRTVPYDQAGSPEQNHAAAAGVLFNLKAVTTAEQRAKVMHPSGGQRVTQEYVEVSPDKFVTRWTFDV